MKKKKNFLKKEKKKKKLFKSENFNKNLKALVLKKY